MRMLWLALSLALLAGCGSGGGAAVGVVDPGQDPGPDPVPTAVTVRVGTRGPSADTVIYGVQFDLHLPAGVTVPADPEAGALPPAALQFADDGATAGGSYFPATATARARVKVVIADPAGFTLGELATLNCAVSPGVTVTTTDFTLDGFLATDASGVEMPEVTPRFTVRMQ